jgi:hypothetical protein
MSSLTVTPIQNVTTSTAIGGVDVVDVEPGAEILVGNGPPALDWSTNATSTGVSVENDGTIDETGTAAAIGTGNAAPTGAITITNTGTISSAGGRAIDFSSVPSGGTESITNSGTITGGDGIAIWFGAGADTLTNSGTINGAVYLGAGDKVTNSASGTINGTLYLDAGSVSINNSGSIVTVGASIDFSSASGGTEAITNSGVITPENGIAIRFGDGNDTLTNTGLIEGVVYLGAGNNVVNSTSSGDYYLGAGSNTLTFGEGGSTVYVTAGTNVVDAGPGPGISTISYANAASGVIVSLALQGHAQSTGVSTDTLTDFQNLVGSPYNDRLAGDSQNNTLTGGLGADVFVFRPGGGTDAVTDFNPAQGDKIDLSAFHLGSLNNPQFHMGEPDGFTAELFVGNGGGDALYLESTNFNNLTAQDFILTPPVSDFNGDGISDIVWQNTDGTVAVWDMTGLAISGVTIPGYASGWQAQDTGDFNGDGATGDILFRNQTTGQVAIWLDGAAGIIAAGMQAILPASWQIMGTGDFNGDGMSDVLLRNETTGQVAIWQMNGLTLQAAAIPAVEPLNWKIVGIGDFNGDGMSDILWKDANTGQVAIWEMNGFNEIAAAAITVAPAPWQVAGVGDFDGDGKSDILFRNQSTGQVAIWEMNGLTEKAAGIPGVIGLDWQIVGTEDVNGDGKSDILWKNTTTGQIAVWEMNGLSVANAGVLAIVDNHWVPLNHHFDWV